MLTRPEPGWVVTSIGRTAYPRFKRLITAHELHLFFSPTHDELERAADRTDSDEHLLALLQLDEAGAPWTTAHVPRAVPEWGRPA